MSSLVEVEALPPSQRGPSIDLIPSPGHALDRGGAQGANLLELAWRARWLILLCTLIGGAINWAWLQRVTPRYTSTARIYVERNLPQILDSQLSLGQSLGHLHTQAELLQSTSVLALALDNPEIANLPSLRGATNPIGAIRPGLKVRVGQLNEIIDVSLELPEAEDAGKIVMAIVNAYISEYSEKKQDDTSEVLAILHSAKEKRDQELKEQLQKLHDFRTQNAELAVQFRSENIVSNRFALLSEELNQTEIQLLEAKALFNRVKKMYDAPTLRGYLLKMAQGGDGVGAANDPDQQGLLVLQNQIQDLEMQLVDLRSRWGEGHQRVKLLAGRLATLQAQETEMKNTVIANKATIVDGYVESRRQEFELLQHKRDELQAAYDAQFTQAKEISAKAIQLAALESEVKRTEKSADILDERIRDLNLTEDASKMITSVSVLEPAGVGYQTYPVPSKFLAMGILLGGMSGLGLAWLRDLLDHRLKSIDEIAALMQVPVLGALPHQETHRDRSKAARVVADEPRSAASEAFRTLRTAVHFGLAGDDCRVVTITSPSPGDGKSTVASNFAIATAQADRKVLLIDADMRKPTQHKIFRLEAKQGLSTALTERHPVEEAIAKGVTGSLDVLPCGPLPANPVELLNNGYFTELIRTLGDSYDKIIIDSPPVMPVADARIICAMSDAVLLVLRAERSTRRLSLAARNELLQVRVQKLGIVINDVSTHKAGAYYGYGYGYGGYGAYGYGGPAYGQVEDKRPQRRRPAETH